MDREILKNSQAVPHDTACICISMKNGECYVVKYNCKDKVVSNILLSDYEYYQGIIDLNESKRETRRVTRERIDLSKY